MREPMSAAILGASQTKNQVVLSETLCQQYIKSAVPISQINQERSCLLRLLYCQTFVPEESVSAITALLHGYILKYIPRA